MKRIMLLAAFLLFVVPATASVIVNPDEPTRKPMTNGSGSDVGASGTITCYNRYYRICSTTTRQCNASSDAGSCCNLCVYENGNPAPCQTCSAGA
jgi:hypothetical protein